jgi:hypothetical protein
MSDLQPLGYARPQSARRKLLRRLLAGAVLCIGWIVWWMSMFIPSHPAIFGKGLATPVESMALTVLGGIGDLFMEPG